MLHNNVLMVNLCHRQQRKVHVPVFERNYVTSISHSFHTLHKDAPLKEKKKKKNCSKCSLVSFTYTIWLNRTQQRKLLRSFSFLFSVSVKHITRSHGIVTSESVTIKYYERVCILSLITRHANRSLSVLHYIVTSSLSSCTTF